MAESTAISWCDHTFNPWIGCTKVSVGDKGACEGCYAEVSSPSRALKVLWGDHPRHRTSASYWNQPLAWDRKAARDGVRRFVFCASLADVFDNQVDPEWRRELFDLIRATPNLVWLLLTKRPQNIVKLFADTLPPTADKRDAALRAAWPPNAAPMCTAVTQAEADRDIPYLVRAKAVLGPAFIGVSMEPLMEGVDLSQWLWTFKPCADCPCPDPAVSREGYEACCRDPELIASEIDWVITGGGTDQGAWKAPPANPAWFRDIHNQCDAVGVAFHHKQNGEWLARPELIDGGGPSVHRFPDGVWMDRVGKRAAGRLLDGVQHDARPAVSAIGVAP